MIQTINAQRNFNSAFTTSLPELPNQYDRFNSESEDELTLNKDLKKHWWNRCCIKMKIEESSQDFIEFSSQFGSHSSKKLSKGRKDDDKYLYDQAMECLCFTCPKCLRALEKGREAITTPTQAAEVLEFLTNCTSGEDVALAEKLHGCN